MTASLLKKEFILTMHPMTAIFIMFGIMLLIPAYPYTVAFFYVCLGLFFTFINARENKDNLYLSLLPVSKKDTVRAKFLFAVIIEISSIVFSVPFAIITVNINPTGTNSAGIDANVALYGFVFMMFAAFNYVFFTSFYKTAYKVGKSFLIAVIPVTVIAILAETLSHIPFTSDYIDSVDKTHLMKQLPVLIFGILIYLLLTMYSLKKSTYEYENVDL